MKIGIIGAMQMEVDNLKEALENQTSTNAVLNESGAVEETVIGWLYDNAKIK